MWDKTNGILSVVRSFTLGVLIEVSCYHFSMDPLGKRRDSNTSITSFVSFIVLFNKIGREKKIIIKSFFGVKIYQLLPKKLENYFFFFYTTIVQKTYSRI